MFEAATFLLPKWKFAWTNHKHASAIYSWYSITIPQLYQNYNKLLMFAIVWTLAKLHLQLALLEAEIF